MQQNIKHNPRRGFTLIELLVVIAIIALLVSIVLVVTTKAIRSAENSATRFLMHSISDGLEQFNSDFGYYPPLLQDDFHPITPDRPVLEVQPNAGEALREHRYFSMSSLSVYLIGIGRLEPSPLDDPGLDPDRHDGLAGPGFRDPGPDRSWGGALDRSKNAPKKTGRTYGPYVDLADSPSIRALGLSDLGRNFPGNPRFHTTSVNIEEDIDTNFRVIVDAWGTPIRYYRPGWLTRRPGTGEFTLDYAPIELLNMESIQGGFSPDSDPVMTSAPFFLLSAGADKKFAGTIPGGDLAEMAYSPLDINETNTQILDLVDDTPGELKKVLEIFSDNIRVTP